MSTMHRQTSPWRVASTAGFVFLLGLVLGGGCSSGEKAGTCFFRCVQEATGAQLYGCKPANKPSDDCAAVGNEYCLTFGFVTGRSQFVEDCYPDCQSATSCANCAPSWHAKMCVESGDASDDGGGDAASSDDAAVSDDAAPGEAGSPNADASADASDDAL